MKKWTGKEYAEYILALPNDEYADLMLNRHDEYQKVYNSLSSNDKKEFNRIKDERLGTIPDDYEMELPDDMGDPFLNGLVSQLKEMDEKRPKDAEWVKEIK